MTRLRSRLPVPLLTHAHTGSGSASAHAPGVRAIPSLLGIAIAVSGLPALTSVIATPVRAEVPWFTWQEANTLDSWELGGSDSGISVALLNGEPQVLYVKGGGIYFTHQSGGVWSPPIELHPAGRGAGHPGLTVSARGDLLAVWHAGSPSGRMGIHARFGSGATWEPATIVSEPGLHSMNPVTVAPRTSLARSMVAWEDSTSGVWRVRTRVHWSWGPHPGWEAIGTFGDGVADARDPSFGLVVGEEFASLVWADRRGGDFDVYEASHRFENWDPERLLLDAPADLRHPVTAVENEGQGTWNPTWFVACRALGAGGAAEILGSFYTPTNPPSPPAFWLSPDDGVASKGAALDGLTFGASDCTPFGWETPVFLPAWIEEGSGIQQTRRTLSSEEAADFLPSPGALVVDVAEDEGTVVQTWVELESGIVYLRARTGTTLDCWRVDVAGLTPLLLGPEGEPPTRLRILDECSGVGVWGDVTVHLETYDGVVFDPTQSEFPYAESDEDGYVTLPLLGGGCSMSSVEVESGGWGICETTLVGIHSPDIDGDCAVTDADREYVADRLGTSDFCADIDGSGLVDEADLAIVDATLGDACSNVTDAGSSGMSPGAPSLTIRPNPARDWAILRFRGAAAAPQASGSPGSSTATSSGAARGVVRVVDAAGRVVRSFPLGQVQGEGGIRWDLSDATGHPLPAGMYFAVAPAERGTLRTPILIVR